MLGRLFPIATLAAAMFLCGCTHAKKPESPVTFRDSLPPAAAGALVFDPPVAIGQPPLALDRDARMASAYVGYESSVATYFYVRTDDRMLGDRRQDRYERRAISEKVGVSYR